MWVESGGNMEIYIIIIIIFFLILFIPTSKYLSNRLDFVVLLIVKLKRKKYNKYGSLFFRSYKRTSFYVETQDRIYSVIQLCRFYKYMLFFDRRGTAQIRHIGARRLIPYKAFYNIDVSNLDFSYGIDSLPSTAHEKPIIPILLMVPAPVCINIPYQYSHKWEVETGNGEFIENFYISDSTFFLKLLNNDAELKQ